MEKFCVRNENKGTVLPWLCISSTIIYFSYFVPSFLSQIPFLVLGVILIWNTTLSYHLALEPNITHMLAEREIAPNTGANATKFFTLATKSWKLVAKLATRMFHHNLT